jgi:endonuclease YncB( thermonuclease family)
LVEGFYKQYLDAEKAAYLEKKNIWSRLGYATLGIDDDYGK